MRYRVACRVAAQGSPEGHSLKKSHWHKGFPSCLFLLISATFRRVGQMFLIGRQEMRLLTPLNMIIAAHAFLPISEPCQP